MISLISELSFLIYNFILLMSYKPREDRYRAGAVHKERSRSNKTSNQ